MKTDIILVTHRPAQDIQHRVTEILDNTSQNDIGTIFVTCQVGKSASINRNFGLSQVESEVFVMMDDDITGFYPGWLQDLVDPMIEDNGIVISSARMLNIDRKCGPMMGSQGLPRDKGIHDVKPCGYKSYKRVLTACLAISSNVVRFDEGFIGSGYEDTAYMNEINNLYPNDRIVVNNDCRLVHINNMCNQGGEYFDHNKAHYLSLYPDDETVKNQKDWT